MNRKLFGVFSGANLTAIIIAAVLAPSALVAAVTYSNVAVVNPTTGKPATVDALGNLHTQDSLSQYRDNPLNYVKITGYVVANNTSNPVYTVPSGKALIIQTVNMTYYSGIAGNDNYSYLYENGATFVAGFDNPNTSGSYTSYLGSGYYVKTGTNLSITGYDYSDTNMQTFFSVTGYLVPAAYAPPASETAQEVHVGVARKK